MSSCTLSDLPHELLDEIAGWSPRATWLALCQTSKFLNLLAISWLYREIEANSATQIVRICKAIIFNPIASKAVRTLRLTPKIQSGAASITSQNTYLKGFCRLINQALPLVIGVHELTFLLGAFDEEFALKDCTFPYLRSYESSFCVTSETLHFLNRHPSLTEVTLQAYNPDLRACPRIQLPNLNVVVIFSEIIPFISFNAPITRFFIVWSLADHDYDRCFRAVCESTCTALDLGCTFAVWRPSILESLFRCMDSSRLRSLMLSNIGHVTNQGIQEASNEEWLELIGSALEKRRLPNLVLIRCFVVTFFADTPSIFQYDQDFEYVQHWSRVCPALKAVLLPSGLTWFRTRGQAWVPNMSPPVAKRWLCEMLRSGRYPKVDPVTPCLEFWRETRGIFDPLGFKDHHTWFSEVQILGLATRLPVPIPYFSQIMDDDIWMIDDEEMDLTAP